MLLERDALCANREGIAIPALFAAKHSVFKLMPRASA